MSTQPIDQVNLLLTEVREEVARAEAKASTLFAATGVLIAIVAAIATSASVDGESLGAAQRVALIAGCASVLAANAALAASIWPRRAKHPGKGWPNWFGEVALEARRSAANATSNDEALELFTQRLAGEPPDAFARACHQLWNMSKIADAKQSAVRVAVLLFGLGVFLTVVPSMIQYAEF